MPANIEHRPFAGHNYRVGYTTFKGQAITYNIRKATVRKGYVGISLKPGAPVLHADTLAQMSSELYNVELKYPA